MNIYLLVSIGLGLTVGVMAGALVFGALWAIGGSRNEDE